VTEYKFEEIDGVKLANFSSFPKELGNMWLSFYKFKNHGMLHAVVCMYQNDLYPPGTIVESPYMYNDYPDAYSVYRKMNDDKIFIGTRIYTNPEFRGNGWWKYLIAFLRDFLYTNFEMYTDAGKERTLAGEKIFRNAQNMVNQYTSNENDGRMNSQEILPPRDPCYPETWYNHRIGGRVNELN
jgi:hypothetical protein